MITENNYSLSAMVEWANKSVNNINGTTEEIQTAFHQVLKAGIKKANYPSCEAELGVIDQIKDFDVTPLAEQLPNIIAKYMAEEKRPINLPAVDDVTAPGSLRLVHKDEAVNEGVIQMGARKGEKYKSVVKAHDEYKIVSKKDKFKD